MLELLFLFGIAYGELDLTDIDKRIDEQKTVMQNLEKLVIKAKDDLKKAKQNQHKSWDGSIHLVSVQTALKDAETNAKNGRDKWLGLLREKSDMIKENRLAEEQKIKNKEAELVANTSGLIKLIGVDISQSCKMQIKNNLTTNCPSFLDLRDFDSSRQEISGFFKKINGYYFREPPTLLESWRFYDHDPTIRVIVDPPSGMAERIRMIVIQDNFDTYKQNDSHIMKQNYVILNGTSKLDEWGNSTNYSKLDKPSIQTKESSTTLYHDRYVDKKCKNAIINAKKWEILLPDTINYMQNNCAESSTNFNNKEIIVKQLTSQDITTSQKYKDEQRLKWIKEFCIFKFKAC